MSYILDALRKADAQRERSRAPGLHDQPVLRAEPDAPPAWRRPVLLGAAAAVGLLSLAWVAWQTAVRPAVVVTPPAAPVVAAAPAAVPEPQPAPVPAAAVEPPPPEPRPAPTVAAVPAPTAPRPAPAARSPASVAAPVARSAPVAAPAPATVAAPAPAPVAAAAAPAASAAHGDVGPAPAGAPRVAISGGVYSQNPAQRMLIVGGQVFNEGSEVAPGVRLEQVQPNQAVLSWRGQRYAVRF
jgi:general secretion pathway protein B